jgi:hypothetical protein
VCYGAVKGGEGEPGAQVVPWDEGCYAFPDFEWHSLPGWVVW